MKKLNLFIIALITLSFSACQSDSSTKATEKKEVKEVVKETPKAEEAPKKEQILSEGAMQNGGIKLIPVNDSPKFSEAKISLKKPTLDDRVKAGTVLFDFGVENYELGNQTGDAKQKNCANSAKGQHIHLILNNAPYSAFYESTFDKKLEEGAYTMLAFLSRSYHESIKQKDAYVLSSFTVGEGEYEAPNIDKNGPNMFYSRPKGQYLGPQNVKRVMLDFFLVNCDLSPEGYKVKATINGTSFTITKWQPYFMEGLPMGENIIQLELLDKDNKPVPGEYNKVTRKVRLQQKEPLTD